AAGVEVLASDLGLKGRGVPQLEGVGRLDVEVPVTEERRRVLGVRDGAKLADGQRLTLPVDQLSVAAGRADEVTHPPAGRPHLAGSIGVRADRGDAQEARELVKPVRHGTGSLPGTPPPPR